MVFVPPTRVLPRVPDDDDDEHAAARSTRRDAGRRREVCLDGRSDVFVGSFSLPGKTS
jgi:hypothetical protein